MKDFPTIEAQRKFFTSLCAKERIDVENMDQKCQPHAIYDKRRNRCCIVLNRPCASEFTEWLWNVHHEGSHLFEEVLFCYDGIPMCKNDMEKTAMNIIADFLCEYNKRGIYPGRDRAIDQGVSEWSNKNSNWLLNRPLILQALSRWDDENRQAWQCLYGLPNIDPRAESILETLKTMSLETRIPQLLVSRDPKELYAIVQEIVNIETEEEQDGNNITTGEEGGDNPEGGEETCADQEASGDAGQTDTSGGEPPNLQPEQSDEQQEPGKEEGAESEASTEETQTGGGVGACDMLGKDSKYSDMSKKFEYEETQNEEYFVPTNNIEVYQMPDNYTYTMERKLVTDLMLKSTVSKQIQKYLKVMSKDSYEYGLQHGRLHTKNIHRMYQHQGTGGARVFKRKNNHILKVDTAVSLLLDCSGSMDGNPIRMGLACVAAISKTLRELRIPFEAAGFTTSGSMVRHMFFKQFNDSVSDDTMLNRLCSHDRHSGCNSDGENVMYSAERLMTRKEPNKILIVLSDGQPTSYAEGSDEWYLKQVTGMIESNSPIDLIGIGIDTAVVKRYYSNSAVVRKLTDLDKVLFETLRRNLT